MIDICNINLKKVCGVEEAKHKRVHARSLLNLIL